MPLSRTRFGSLPDGRTAELFTLTNANGLRARVTNYGGTLVSLDVPDRRGVLADVVLGFDALEPYLGEHPYFGSLIGRYANRIRGGSVELDGTEYRLPCNDGSNHLHGGPRGFHTVLWNAKPLVSFEEPAVELSYTSVDGEQGYPGQLEVTVRYTVSADDALKINYAARTDAPTIVNLTNHAYFNLAGHGTIRGHTLQLNASHFLPVDDALIPTGELRVVGGTPFDFTHACTIGARIDSSDEQLARGRGYDHTWVLDEHRGCARAGALNEPASGRIMSIYTTQPGVQIYSGNFLDGTLRGKNGVAYVKHAGLCIETQHFPDSPHHAAFPSTVLEPGVWYRETTIYRFENA